jgi:hypothetical protein
MVICHRVESSFLSWESVLFLVPYIYVMWAIIHMQVMLSSICSLISSCGVADNCGEIIMCSYSSLVDYRPRSFGLLYMLCLVWRYHFFPLLDIETVSVPWYGSLSTLMFNLDTAINPQIFWQPLPHKGRE